MSHKFVFFLTCAAAISFTVGVGFAGKGGMDRPPGMAAGTKIALAVTFDDKSGTRNLTVVEDSSAKLVIDKADGTCRQTYDKAYFPFASTQWENCKGWPAPDGRREMSARSGELWPLVKGNKMTFQVHGFGKKDWKNKPECVVEGNETITVPAGTFETVKVVCEDQADKRSYWMAEGIGYPVQFIQDWKRRKGTSSEKLISITSP